MAHRINMKYDYKKFMDELDEEINEVIEEMENQVHRRMTKKKNKMIKEIQNSVQKAEFRRSKNDNKRKGVQRKT